MFRYMIFYLRYAIVWRNILRLSETREQKYTLFSYSSHHLQEVLELISNFLFFKVTGKKFWLRLKEATMKEFCDHLKLAQMAFGCHFARKLTCVTRNAVQLKRGTVNCLLSVN